MYRLFGCLRNFHISKILSIPHFHQTGWCDATERAFLACKKCLCFLATLKRNYAQNQLRERAGAVPFFCVSSGADDRHKTILIFRVMWKATSIYTIGLCSFPAKNVMKNLISQTANCDCACDIEFQWSNIFISMMCGYQSFIVWFTVSGTIPNHRMDTPRISVSHNQKHQNKNVKYR